MQRRVALYRRLPQRRALPLAGIDPAHRRHDVLAGPQQRRDLVRIRQQRRVHHRVGVQGQNLVDAVGCGDAQRFSGDNVADVLARLVL
jgi:hypothetical protein